MAINLLLKGFGVGLVVAIPIGPVGLLVTQRILTSGRMHGLVSGLGAATRLSTAGQLVTGVFLGSMFWWILLSASVGVFHKRLSDGTLLLLTHIFGSILVTLGIAVIISTLVSRASSP